MRTWPRVYNNFFVIALGKVAQLSARLKGGGGSAFPGLLVDKIAPNFAAKVLGSLPYGVVVVSGTNGKTTTTKVITELLESQQLRVLTNESGSNFMRGVISTLLTKISLTGRLDAHIAVLELDEAHALPFALRVPPRYTLLLNVMPDQLDRFGSVENVAKLLTELACLTTQTVVANREDRLLAALATNKNLAARLCWFGLSPQLRPAFNLDDTSLLLPGAGAALEDSAAAGGVTADGATAGGSTAGGSTKTQELSAVATLVAAEDGRASFELDGSVLSAELALKGIFSAFDAAAALALVKEVLGESHPELNRQLVKALAKVQGAFGRGETFVVGGINAEMVLVKNAGGFGLALESFEPQGYRTMIVINDGSGDGRDMSWLFDTDFSSLAQEGVEMVSGTRAWDTALRLSYDEVRYQQVEPNPLVALDNVLANVNNASSRQKPLRIYCNYTAMMKLRVRLEKLANTKQVSA